ARGVHDGLQVCDHRVEAVVGRIAVRQTVSTGVVADDGEALTEGREPVTPDRARPVVLEVSQPRARSHERRAIAVTGPGDACAIRRGRERNLVPHGEILAAGYHVRVR